MTDNKCWREYRETESSFTVGGLETSAATVEISVGILKRLKKSLP